jgi:hypothetical protein
MIVWGKAPWRFFALGSGGGLLLGYVLFKVAFGLPEGFSMGLGMILLWPVATLLEFNWRRKSGYRLIDNKASSIIGIPTWIITAILAVTWTLLYVFVELR